jgi:hypothetical protein
MLVVLDWIFNFLLKGMKPVLYYSLSQVVEECLNQFNNFTTRSNSSDILRNFSIILRMFGDISQNYTNLRHAKGNFLKTVKLRV